MVAGGPGRPALFFSHGLDCVRALDATPIEERESWFEDFPGKRPEFAQFLSRATPSRGIMRGVRPVLLL